MTDRIKEIFSLIPTCESFADIGCDHGYLSNEVIKSGKAKKVVFSDISAKCLSKAQELLAPFVNKGVAEGFVTSGFEGLPLTDCALIAGMGGEEIISIINKACFLPNCLILQPMKNSDKVRLTLVGKGFKIIKDYTFFADGKFYDIILSVKGEDFLTDDEIFFGRTNLLEKPNAFIDKWKGKKGEIERYLSEKNLGEKAKEELLALLKRIEKIC